MKKILVIGPAWVGDMVMAQSLFKTLRALDPSCLIDVLAPAWSQPLLDRMPEVHQSFELNIPHGVLGLKTRYQTAKQLRAARYTQAIVLPNSWKSALIPYWAKIPRRTGYIGEGRFGLLNDWRVLDKPKLPKMVERFVALAYEKKSPTALSYAFPSLQTDPQSVQKALNQFLGRVPERPILALCPGAEFGASKRWPERYYAEIAERKLDEGWEVWLLGSPKDEPVSAFIQKATQDRCVNLTGKTALAEAIDLLSVVNLAVCNDSGLMHVAAALGKPLVALYGSTDPRFAPPLQKNAVILSLSLDCSPCRQRECPLGHHRCLEDLHPDTVWSALAHLEKTACVSS